MTVFFALAIAIFIDRLFGMPRSYNPLGAYIKFANFIENSWHRPQELVVSKSDQPNKLIVSAVKIQGLFALLFLTLPLLTLVLFLQSISWLNLITNVAVLYLSIRAHSLQQNAQDMEKALSSNNLEQAQKALAPLTEFDTANMTMTDITSSFIEAILVKGNVNILASIFWFIILGAPGVILHRLVNTLHVLWNNHKSRYYSFGIAAGLLDEWLNFIPARLAALSYMLLAQMKSGWQSLLQLHKSEYGLDEGVLIAAGAGALNVQIGGDVYCEGKLIKRTKLGAGPPPVPADISRAWSLVERSMILYLVMTFVLCLSHC